MYLYVSFTNYQSHHIESLSLTLHAINGHFICQPLNIENYSTGYNLDSSKIFQNMEVYWGIYFYTFIPILGSEFQLEMPLNSIIINSKSEKLPLNKLSKWSSIDIFKMKNR